MFLLSRWSFDQTPGDIARLMYLAADVLLEVYTKFL
ncbi:hypothetical protein JMJ77_0007898 [Colletotrichum scovillei]|uniref:Uncharacterized protein n=1 Tax=Colletotrichum scovillei TaxID=1209932 RepID=A0A9P7RFX9_9PEZI|nr:hypothetical protein JMJ77_0007898 [Colletotrichum scovillei]KAG7082081.1 hypothetical protein JMJ78_0004186 [Colletotrichum scovillei]